MTDPTGNRTVTFPDADLDFNVASGTGLTFDASAIGSPRTLTVQDASGTIAYLSDITGGSSLWEDGTTVYEDDKAVTVGADSAPTYGANSAGTLRVGQDFETIGDGYFDDNLVIGAGTSSSSTLSNGSFTLDGDDLFVGDSAGIEGEIYTDSGLTIGATTTFDDGEIDSSGKLSINTTNNQETEFGGNVIPVTDDDYNLGSSLKRWQDLYLGPASLHIGTDGNEGVLSYDTANSNFNFDSDFVPTGDGTLDIGSDANRVDSLYVDSAPNTTPDGIWLGPDAANQALLTYDETNGAAGFYSLPSITTNPVPIQIAAPEVGIFSTGTGLDAMEITAANGSVNISAEGTGESVLIEGKGGGSNAIELNTGINNGSIELDSGDAITFNDANLSSSIPFTQSATSLNTTAQGIVDAINEVNAAAGGSIDLDGAYDNDGDKVLNIDDTAGLEFSVDDSSGFTITNAVGNTEVINGPGNSFIVQDLDFLDAFTVDSGGNISLGFDSTDLITYNGTIATNIDFEGATVDASQTTFDITDPTADNTITVPDSDGIIAWEDGTSGVFEDDEAVIVGSDTAFNVFDGGVGDLQVTNELEVGGSSAFGGTLTANNITYLGTLTSPSYSAGSAEMILPTSAGVPSGTPSEGSVVWDENNDNLYVYDTTAPGFVQINGGGGTGLWEDGTTVYEDDKAVTVGADSAPTYGANSAGTLRVGQDFETIGDGYFDDNLVIGAGTSTSSTLSNGSFTLDGDDLFVADSAGIEGEIYTDSGLTIGATTTFDDGEIDSASGPLAINTSNNNAINLGTGTLNAPGSIEADGGVTTTGGSLALNASTFIELGTSTQIGSGTNFGFGDSDQYLMRYDDSGTQFILEDNASNTNVLTVQDTTQKVDFVGAVETAGALTINGNTNLNQDVFLGSSTIDLITFQGDVAGNILPDTTTNSFGDDASRWGDVFVGTTGALHVGTSTTDEGTLSYNTTGNILNIVSDGTIEFNDSNLSSAIPLSAGDASLNTTAQGIIDAINEVDASAGGGGDPDQDFDGVYDTSVANANLTMEIDNGSLNYNLTGTDDFAIQDSGATFASFLDNGNVDFANDLTVDSNTLFVDASTNEVGINTSIPSAALDVAGTSEFSSTASFDGNVNLGNSLFDDINFNGAVHTDIVFEGSTNDGNETTFDITNPTADRTVTFKDESGTVAYLSDVGGGTTLWESGTNGTYEDDDAVIVGGDGAFSTASGGIGDLKVNDELEVVGNAYLNGDIELGNTSTDDITFTGQVDSSILPALNDNYDLGSNSNRWRDIYLGPDTLHIGTSTTDEGTLSYDTSFDFFNIASDGDVRLDGSDAIIANSGTGDISLFVGGTSNQALIMDNSSGITALRATSDLRLESSGTSTNSLRLDSDGGVDIDSDSDTRITTNSGLVWLESGSTSLAAVNIDSAGGVDIDPSGGFYVDAGASSNLRTSSGLLTIDATGTTTSDGVLIQSVGEGADSIKLDATGGTESGIDMDSLNDINLESTGSDIFLTANGSIDLNGTVRVDLDSASSSAAVCKTGGSTALIGVDLTDCTGTPSADYMEMYPATSDVTTGDLVEIGTTDITTEDGDTIKQITKSTGAYSGKIIGIASNPSEAGDFNSIGYNIADTDNPYPVALNGRVKLNVTDQNGAIAPGDPITSSTTAGVGMKATQPGMIVGYALEAHTSGTGQIMVFVGPGYHSGTTIANDGTMPTFNSDFAYTKTAQATSTDEGKASHTLMFRGSGWDGSQAKDVAMQVNTQVTDANQYRLSIKDATDSEVAYISNNGKMEIAGDMVVGGKLYPSDRGTPQTDKYIYYDGSSDTGGNRMYTNADGWGSGTSYDFAEMFPTTQNLEKGEVVTFAPNNEHVRRTETEYAQSIAGVVSTKPGFLAGEVKEGSYPIALAGRVPTKVNMDNGPIEIGDPLTSSGASGVAMKATEPGMVLGYALEPYNGSGPDNKIIAFINASYFDGSAADDTVPGTQNSASQVTFGSNNSNLSSLDMEGNIYMHGNEIRGIGKLVGLGERWSVGEDGTFATKASYDVDIKSYQGEDVKTHAKLAREHTVTLSGTSKLSNGSTSIDFEDEDPQYNDIISTQAPIRVYVTLRGPANGIYVQDADHNGFTVSETMGGSSNVEFDWFVEAYRKGYEPEEALSDSEPGTDEASDDTEADDTDDGGDNETNDGSTENSDETGDDTSGTSSDTSNDDSTNDGDDGSTQQEGSTSTSDDGSNGESASDDTTGDDSDTTDGTSDEEIGTSSDDTDATNDSTDTGTDTDSSTADGSDTDDSTNGSTDGTSGDSDVADAETTTTDSTTRPMTVVRRTVQAHDSTTTDSPSDDSTNDTTDGTSDSSTTDASTDDTSTTTDDTETTSGTESGSSE